MIVRIAHVSDIHFGGEIAGATEAVLDAVAAFAPTLTVVTGDLTLNGLPAEFIAARAWLDRLAGPRLVTPGNHDTPYWNLVLRAFTPFARYRRYIGRASQSGFDTPGLTARCVNSARGAQPRPNWSQGAMSIARIDALDWASAAEPSVRLFACHHPLIDIEGAPVTGGVRRGALAADRLAAAGVDLILTGHVHNPFVLPLGRGGRACYCVGAGTLSQRTRGTPASFTTIVAGETCFEIAVIGWIADRFETMRSWSLPRQPADRSASTAA